MLHILLLILKIIGIIFAVILGILVLLVFTVVFVPVRYEVKAGCEGNPDDIKAKGKVTWLFRFVRADLYYKEKKLKWRVRIAWKKILGGVDYKKDNTDNSEDDFLEAVLRSTEVDDIGSDDMADTEEIRFFMKEDKDEKQDEEIKKAAENEKTEKNDAKDQEEPVEIPEGFEEAEKSMEKENGSEKESGFHDETRDKADHETQGLYENIKDAYHKIKYTIQEICDKIKELLEKKNKLLEFVQNEVHRGAFAKLKKETIKLFRRLKPKKLQVKAVFGFEDPSITGRVLGAIALFYPFYLDGVSLRPDFERRILKGKLYGKGHIRFFYLVHFAWKLFRSRDVRRTYKDIRNFEI